MKTSIRILFGGVSLAVILGGSKSSRLYAKLVYDEKVAQNVNCSFSEMTLGSVIGCDILIKPGATPADVEKGLDLEIAALRDKGPTQEEVKRAQTMQKAAALMALESASRRADLLNRYNHFVGDPGFFEKDQARYAAATAKSIQTQAKKWLDHRRVVVIVTPEGK